MKKPMTEPRRIVHLVKARSFIVTKLLSIFNVLSVPAACCSTRWISSAIPNRPMTTTRKSIPARMSGMPKVKRATPVFASMPTEASIRPMRAARSVFTGFEPTSEASEAKAKTISAT